MLAFFLSWSLCWYGTLDSMGAGPLTHKYELYDIEVYPVYCMWPDMFMNVET